ncbi:hypothetical protein [Rhodanobacter terrae]|uniref:Uncharacterized protein n=1 Tax=Rhodanobacter terrae TaxID=418647 RepID=A0ABW0T130_9GAMM
MSLVDLHGTASAPTMLCFFGGIVSSSTPRLRIVAAAIAQENVVAAPVFGDERRGAGHLGRSPREPG